MEPTLIAKPSLHELLAHYLRKATNNNSLICKDLSYI